VAFDILEENERPLTHQLVSLRLLDSTEKKIPTTVGILSVGKTPRDYIYGAYIQFLRIDGTELTDPIIDQKEIDDPLPTMLRLVPLLKVGSKPNSLITRLKPSANSYEMQFFIVVTRQITRQSELLGLMTGSKYLALVDCLGRSMKLI